MYTVKTVERYSAQGKVKTVELTRYHGESQQTANTVAYLATPNYARVTTEKIGEDVVTTILINNVS